ncbi:GbsR/MarR family transcriptional regulator [Pseudonocardia sp. GCM10023141]|uniref:GbsR/MarR family transcriptional regulator n=1 Tax=Pseudonocardia sp. GCM10023141 TaxID=3252653 RepID=UPI00361D6C89
MSMTVEHRAYVERFALVLTDTGMQRMSARVLALFVCSDAPTLTGTAIAEQLDVSAAAVSGAVRALQQAGLVRRVPAPGSRRDHYQLAGDGWADAGVARREHLDALAALAGEGLGHVEPNGSAATRLQRMQDLYAFLAEEIPALLARWRERQATQPAAD